MIYRIGSSFVEFPTKEEEEEEEAFFIFPQGGFGVSYNFYCNSEK
jgi:hypothetical protein